MGFNQAEENMLAMLAMAFLLCSDDAALSVCNALTLGTLLPSGVLPGSETLSLTIQHCGGLSSI